MNDYYFCGIHPNEKEKSPQPCYTTFYIFSKEKKTLNGIFMTANIHFAPFHILKK